MLEELPFALGLPVAEAEETGVVAECGGDFGFCAGLRSVSAHAGDHREWARRVGARLHFVHRQLEHRTKQANRRVTNCELRCVHANRYAAGAGVDVVARESALARLIECTVASEGQRMGWNDLADPKMFANTH